MKRNTFPLKKSFYKPISNYSDEQLGRLFRAIYQYQIGEAAEPGEDMATVFSFFLAEFEEEEAKRERRAEAARQRRIKKAEEAARAKAEQEQSQVDSGSSQSDPTASSEEVASVHLEIESVEPECQAEQVDDMKKWMKQNAYKVYRTWGKNLTGREYVMLSSAFSQTELERHMIEMHRNPKYINPSMTLPQNVLAKAMAEVGYNVLVS